MRFSEWMARERMKQIDAAHRLGLSQSYISDMVNDRCWPTREIFRRVWRLTDGEVTPNDFLFGDER